MSERGLTRAARRPVAGLLIAGAVILAAPLAAWAEGAKDTSALPPELRAGASAFIAEEVEGAGEEERARMADCVLAAFAGLSGEEMATVVAQDDFEDSLDALVEMRPEAEDAVEACLG